MIDVIPSFSTQVAWKASASPPFAMVSLVREHGTAEANGP